MIIYKDNKSESCKIKPDGIKGFNSGFTCNWSWVIVYDHRCKSKCWYFNLYLHCHQTNGAFSWFVLAPKSNKDALIMHCWSVKSHNIILTIEIIFSRILTWVRNKMQSNQLWLIGSSVTDSAVGAWKCLWGGGGHWTTQWLTIHTSLTCEQLRLLVQVAD